MDARTALAALGVGVATFLGVGAAVTALVDTQTAFVGIPTGVLLGVGAAAFAYVALGRGVTPRFRRLLIATAATGYAAIAFLLVWNPSPALRAAMSVRDVGVLIALVAVTTYAVLLVHAR
jgi:hypothetical protein